MKTKHNLKFEEAGEWRDGWIHFRIGTIIGVYKSSRISYDVLGITNRFPGNGHFEDFIQWFEASCKRDNRDFRILEVMNARFKNHLINKRGFKPIPGTDHVIKIIK